MVSGSSGLIPRKSVQFDVVGICKMNQLICDDLTLNRLAALATDGDSQGHSAIFIDFLQGIGYDFGPR